MSKASPNRSAFTSWSTATRSPGSDHRFVLTGAPGSGKTSILRELEAAGFCVVPEPAREVIAQQRAVDGTAIYATDPKLFWDRMLAKALADYETTQTAKSAVFLDRAIPDLIGYARIFGLDPSAASEAAHRCRYNDNVFVLPSWPDIYVTDEDRKMSVKHADAFGRLVSEAYGDLGYSLVEVPHGTVQSRVDFILERTPTSD